MMMGSLFQSPDNSFSMKRRDYLTAISGNLSLFLRLYPLLEILFLEPVGIRFHETNEPLEKDGSDKRLMKIDGQELLLLLNFKFYLQRGTYRSHMLFGMPLF